MFAEYVWYHASNRDPRAVAIFSRHYSARQQQVYKQWLRYGFTGQGEQIVLLTSQADALFVWRRQNYRKDDQIGVECSVFRNESGELSSKLILQAEQIAWEKWPGVRLFTFVNPSKVKSVNPGYCFKRAGWKFCGKSTKGLHILEKLP